MAPDELNESSWRLEYINLDGVSYMAAGDDPPEITFSEGQFTADDGVNRGGGGFEMGETGFTVGPIAKTRVAYPDPLREENRLFEHLGEVRSWTRHGDMLHLEFPGGEMVYRLGEESGRIA